MRDPEAVVGEGLKRTCRWERSSSFFEMDLALGAILANFLSSTNLAFMFFAAFRLAWSWVLETPQTPAGARQEPRIAWILHSYGVTSREILSCITLAGESKK
jgi:hypothetical protein